LFLFAILFVYFGFCFDLTKKKKGVLFFGVLVFAAEVRSSVSAEHNRSQPSAIERTWDQPTRLCSTITK
jgi:uncharacterized RDD family membrane protein YckC